MITKWDKIKAFFLKYKLHDFDLEKPLMITIYDGKQYNAQIYGRQWQAKVFLCKKCDRQMYLELWQMKSLPYSMKVGCKQ